MSKSIDEQLEQIDAIMQKLCEDFPDLHLLMVLKEDSGTKRSIVGNYCVVCASDQLRQFILVNNIQHNRNEEQEPKNIVAEISKLKH